MFASANSKFKNVHGGTFLNRPVDKLYRLQTTKKSLPIKQKFSLKVWSFLGNLIFSVKSTIYRYREAALSTTRLFL